MTFKQIILELKESCTQWMDHSLTEEKRDELKITLDNNMKQVTKKTISIMEAASKMVGSDDRAKEMLTMLFFTRVVLDLMNRFLIDEKKDIISLPVSCNSKDEISLMLNNLINNNKFDAEYLEQICLVEGIDMEISNEDETDSIWFEINTLDTTKEKGNTKYASVR